MSCGLDENSRSVLLEQLLAETGATFRFSNILLRFDGVLINSTNWISQLESNTSNFRYRILQF